MNEFIDYVWDFYNPKSDLYPIKSLTKEDIFAAFKIYQSRLFNAYFSDNLRYSWGGGDSLDRERVRDILTNEMKFTLTN